MTDDMDIPAFLKIDAARRRAAWDNLPREMARNAAPTDARTDGPGSVALALGYRESDTERAARLDYHATRQQERERLAIVQERRQEAADDESIQRSLMEHKRELRMKELKQGRVQNVKRK